MKLTSRPLPVLILAGALCPASAQVTFTRITTGTLVNERADSDAAVRSDVDNDG